jgi:acetyl-CoA carboxylase carboxyl transferase subunit alpha
MIGGLGKIGGQSLWLLVNKRVQHKTRQYRNFGMANPDIVKHCVNENGEIWYSCCYANWYPGAYPGLEAEERGQGEAIARNIFEMVRLKVPIITIIVGEGASGALGIELERSYIWKHGILLSRILFIYFMEKLGVQRTSCWGFEIDFFWHEKQKLIDDIIPEPLGGAHDRETTFKTVEQYILKHIMN